MKTFSYSYLPPLYPLQWNVTLCLLPIVYLGCLYCGLERSRYETAVRHKNWKNFLSIWGLFFLPVDRVICRAEEDLILIKPNLPFFSFYGMCFWCVVSEKSSLSPRSQSIFFTYFFLNVLSITFSSAFMIHFVLILVQDVSFMSWLSFPPLRVGACSDPPDPGIEPQTCVAYLPHAPHICWMLLLLMHSSFWPPCFWWEIRSCLNYFFLLVSAISLLVFIFTLFLVLRNSVTSWQEFIWV